MSDNPKKVEKRMAKALFVSADDCLWVFGFLAPSQIGLKIALISRRFDCYADEHFKTRKWILGYMQIQSKIGENGVEEMEILNSNQKSLPIPKIPPPKKVIGFGSIAIFYVDKNVIAFLRHFRSISGVCKINLSIGSMSDRISAFFLRDLWPLLKHNTCGVEFSNLEQRCLRHFSSPILSDCQSLRIINFCCVGDFCFPEFPSDDSANNALAAGQSVAKWLLSPLPDGVPKMLRYYCSSEEKWLTKMDEIKTAFANASSPANFILTLWFPHVASFMPFEMINALTGEKLTLKEHAPNHFLLMRCPISRDKSKWAQWENSEAIGMPLIYQRNNICTFFNENHVGDGLLDSIPCSSDRLGTTPSRELDFEGPISFLIWVLGVMLAFWYCFIDMFNGSKKKRAGLSKNA